MVLPETVFVLLPTPATVLVLKRMLAVAVPAAVAVPEPFTVQFLSVLLEAPLMKRTVLVPAVAAAVVLEIVSETARYSIRQW